MKHAATHDLAASLARSIENGSRRDVAACLDEIANPAWLALAVVRHLVSNGADPLDAVVNVQSLAARLGDCPQ